VGHVHAIEPLLPYGIHVGKARGIDVLRRLELAIGSALCAPVLPESIEPFRLDSVAEVVPAEVQTIVEGVGVDRVTLAPFLFRPGELMDLAAVPFSGICVIHTEAGDALLFALCKRAPGLFQSAAGCGREETSQDEEEAQDVTHG
jgi:hypothetical protein